MTTAALSKRLDKITPPPVETYTAPAPDLRTLDSMRDYFAGRPVTIPGLSPGAQQAMRDFLAQQ
jgi:hypothetical protein